ncbi:hypothetical protein RJD39_08635 [Vibrio scophthalmi]|uniref:hypothetical protein n=1 Tax=Vibrio scophthalmi TaxID=45658 RepID=UPI003873BB37
MSNLDDRKRSYPYAYRIGKKNETHERVKIRTTDYQSVECSGKVSAIDLPLNPMALCQFVREQSYAIRVPLEKATLPEVLIMNRLLDTLPKKTSDAETILWGLRNSPNITQEQQEHINQLAILFLQIGEIISNTNQSLDFLEPMQEFNITKSKQNLGSKIQKEKRLQIKHLVWEMLDTIALNSDDTKITVSSLVSTITNFLNNIKMNVVREATVKSMIQDYYKDKEIKKRNIPKSLQIDSNCITRILHDNFASKAIIKKLA